MNNKKCVVILAHDIKNKDNVITLAKQCYEKLGDEWSYLIILDHSEKQLEYIEELAKANLSSWHMCRLAKNQGNYLAPLFTIGYIFDGCNADLMLRFDDDIVLSDSFFDVMFDVEEKYKEAEIVSMHIHNDNLDARELMYDFPCLACYLMKRSYYEKLEKEGWLDFMIWIHEQLDQRAKFGLAWAHKMRDQLLDLQLYSFFFNTTQGQSILGQDMMQLLFIALFKIKTIKIGRPRAGVLAQTSQHLTEEGLKHITKPEEIYTDTQTPVDWVISEKADIMKSAWQ
jgi:hypothetical protein